MANIDDAFPSKYLKAGSLKGTEPIVVIDRVDYELVGEHRERKPVIYFRGKEKGMVLNKTNAMKIVQLSGSGDTDEWPGFRIRLYATETQYAGDTVDCIRVKAATNGKPMAAKALPVSPPPPLPPMHTTDHSGVPDDDDIPF